MKIHMATGVRTKSYRCFLESECKSIQDISIKYGPFNSEIKVYIDGLKFWHRVDNFVVNNSGMFQLAKNDGFDSVEAFFKWFSSDFRGRIIHWTDFKY